MLGEGDYCLRNSRRGCNGGAKYWRSEFREGTSRKTVAVRRGGQTGRGQLPSRKLGINRLQPKNDVLQEFFQGGKV